jgi:hypothetical protein
MGRSSAYYRRDPVSIAIATQYFLLPFGLLFVLSRDNIISMRGRWLNGPFAGSKSRCTRPLIRPLHCHVRKDGNFIGKFNLETGTWITGPKRHQAQANAAIARWRREYGI